MGDMDPLDSQLRFVLEADRLKSVLRRSTLNDGSRRENSAEHSWHLALMALVLGEHAPPGTDLAKVSAMVVLHDLVEIDAGDLYVYADEAAQRRQAVAERAAADRLFGLLPQSRAPRSAPSGTSSSSGSLPRPGSPAPWTGFSP